MAKSKHTRIKSILFLLVCPMLAQNGFGQDLRLEDPSDDDLRVRGIFESNLPKTEKKHSLKAILHPHFGDLHRHDHLRIPIGLRYGVSDVWEVSAGVESYFPHGLGKATTDSGFGMSGYSFGSKYHGGFFSNSKWDQVLGFDYFSPASSPPEDITDGLRHFKPYMNFARYLENSSNSRVFWGLGLDLVTDTGFDGTFRDNAIGDSANTFTAGRVWEGDRLTYTFEANYATSRLIGDNDRDLISLRPGIIWKIPRKYTFNSRGNWILGSALKLNHGHEGFDFGISLKMKVNLKFKD